MWHPSPPWTGLSTNSYQGSHPQQAFVVSLAPNTVPDHGEFHKLMHTHMLMDKNKQHDT